MKPILAIQENEEIPLPKKYHKVNNLCAIIYDQLTELYTEENYKDLNTINFHLEKNGEIVQKGNTANMIYDIDTLIAYVSQYMTLKIGDILFTGTPAGVGPVAIDDKLTGYLENEPLFTVNIK